ncbi:MAG TPA: PAS domain-containing sensor histidine kinase [Candidatus Thermoplasmatota archaeon]|nr:PAS domain-containing sensor histidine kinase [Candidatus Thermoplasmatota archaeon]
MTSQAAPHDRGALRAALDASVHDGLRLASGVIAALLGFFVLVDLLVTPPRWAIEVALVDLASAFVCLGLFFLLRRPTWPPRRAHLVGTILAGTVAAGSLYDTYLLGDPQQTTYLMLVVVGAGAVFLNIRWLYGLVGGTLAGWVLVAASHPEVDWTTFGFALFAASVLSVLIHVLRYTTFERMEGLRIAEAGRKEQLEIRESALESAVEALQASEERYRRLVDGAPDAFLVHSGGKVVYANIAAVRLFGATTAQDLLGRDVFSFVHPEFLDAVKARNAIVEREQRATEPMEMQVLRLDGTKLDVEARDQPIMYLGSHADQTVLRDITDRKRADLEERVASQRLAEISRLKEMDQVKTQFVNTISHELRTPLTPIKVQLHILKNAKDAAAARRSQEVIERNVGRLSSLVDELLEVARIQAGTLKLAKTYIELDQVVGQALESFTDVARQNGIELAVKLEGGLTVLGDAKRVQQVMYNLLGNSFKFTDKGGHIVVEARREGPNALVFVRDSGSGIDPEDLKRLFEPFSQLHDTMEKTNAGTGLGLYICRGIVEGHGGRIWAESDGKGQGARFVFTVPLAHA